MKTVSNNDPHELKLRGEYASALKTQDRDRLRRVASNFGAYLVKAGRYEEGLQVLNNAVPELCSDSGVEFEGEGITKSGDLFFNFGVAYEGLNNFPLAVQFYHHALSAYKTSTDCMAAEAEVCSCLAKIYAEQGMQDEALNMFDNSFELYGRLENVTEQISIRSKQIKHLQRIRDDAECSASRTLISDCIALSECLPNSKKAVKVLLELCRAYIDVRDDAAASDDRVIGVLNRCLNIAKEVGSSRRMKANITCCLADLLAARGDHSAACDEYAKVAIDLGNRHIYWQALESLGVVSFLRNDDVTAVRYFKQSIASLESSDTQSNATQRQVTERILLKLNAAVKRDLYREPLPPSSDHPQPPPHFAGSILSPATATTNQMRSIPASGLSPPHQQFAHPSYFPFQHQIVPFDSSPQHQHPQAAQIQYGGDAYVRSASYHDPYRGDKVISHPPNVTQWLEQISTTSNGTTARTPSSIDLLARFNQQSQPSAFTRVHQHHQGMTSLAFSNGGALVGPTAAVAHDQYFGQPHHHQYSSIPLPKLHREALPSFPQDMRPSQHAPAHAQSTSIAPITMQLQGGAQDLSASTTSALIGSLMSPEQRRSYNVWKMKNGHAQSGSNMLPFEHQVTQNAIRRPRRRSCSSECSACSSIEIDFASSDQFGTSADSKAFHGGGRLPERELPAPTSARSFASATTSNWSSDSINGPAPVTNMPARNASASSIKSGQGGFAATAIVANVPGMRRRRKYRHLRSRQSKNGPNSPDSFGVGHATFQEGDSVSICSQCSSIEAGVDERKPSPNARSPINLDSHLLEGSKSPATGSRHIHLPDDYGANYEDDTYQRSPHSRIPECVALWSYRPDHRDELRLNAGERVVILDKDIEEDGWWMGSANGKVGMFPANYVREVAADGTKASPSPPDPHKRAVADQMKTILESSDAKPSVSSSSSQPNSKPSSASSSKRPPSSAVSPAPSSQPHSLSSMTRAERNLIMAEYHHQLMKAQQRKESPPGMAPSGSRHSNGKQGSRFCSIM